MSTAILTMLVAEPQWSPKLQVTSIGIMDHQMAEIKARLEGQECTTISTFGDAESKPVVGKHVLDRL